MEERPRSGFEPEDDDNDTLDESGATKKSKRKLRLENFFRGRESSEDVENTPRQSRFRTIFRELFPRLVEKDSPEPSKVESQSDDRNQVAPFREFPSHEPALSESTRNDSLDQPPLSEQVVADLNAEDTASSPGPETPEDKPPSDEENLSEFLPFELDIDNKDEKPAQDVLPERPAPEEFIPARTPDINPAEVTPRDEPTASSRAPKAAEAAPNTNTQGNHSGAMLAFLGAEFLSRRRDKKLARRIKNTESEISALGEQEKRVSAQMSRTSKKIEQASIPTQNANEQNNIHESASTEKIMTKESPYIAVPVAPESSKHLQNQPKQPRETEPEPQKLNILSDQKQAEGIEAKNEKEQETIEPEAPAPTEIKETYFDSRHEIKDDTGVNLSDTHEEVRQEKSRREDAYHISEVLKQRNLPLSPVYADGPGQFNGSYTDTGDTSEPPKSNVQPKQYASAAQTGFLTALVILAVAVVIGLASSLV